jgi:hypothetical protein
MVKIGNITVDGTIIVGSIDLSDGESLRDGGVVARNRLARPSRSDQSGVLMKAGRH